MPNIIYEYAKVLPHTPHGRGTEATHVADADLAFVESYISRQEMATLFGGYIRTTDANGSDREIKYIGVWGKDKIRKFLAALKDRGAIFEQLKIDGTLRTIRITSQSGSARVQF